MEMNSPSPTPKKRSLPGTPDPDSDVIALSPKTLLATNRFVCEICGKGFQRDQNLQLHRRGHNLPWKLRQRTNKEVRKRVYVCPDPACVHHHPSRALGDLTGIKKHFCRKHGEKKHNCERCSKKYAVHSDWKAHMKTCGTKDYRCDCGALFSRRDSFTTHRAFCDAIPPPPAASSPPLSPLTPPPTTATPSTATVFPTISCIDPISLSLSSSQYRSPSSSTFPLSISQNIPQAHYIASPPQALSATALLQKATQIGFRNGLWFPVSSPMNLRQDNISTMASEMVGSSDLFCNKPATLDFLGLGMRGGVEAASPSFAEVKPADALDEASERKPSVI